MSWQRLSLNLSTLFLSVLCVLSESCIPACAQTPDVDSSASAPDDLAKAEYVRTKVLPLLEARCFECHGAAVKHPKGDLLLTSASAMLRGGESGAAIVPGDPDESLIIQAVRYEGYEMPPRSRMPEGEVAILEQWVRDGAYWPAELDTAPAVTETAAFPFAERKASHWAWQPLRDVKPPAVQNSEWPNDPLDNFVRHRLEEAGLAPAEDADRNAVIRRLHFDLVGLPPSPEEVAAFVNDPAPTREAMATVVDRLLSSEHFGERWARHWLDMVRYAETLGHEFDYPLRHAAEYRDYVIRALNADVRYDQFVLEHVAGDLLQEPRRHPKLQFNESLIGTGFWYLGEDKHAPVDVRGEEAARVDNQIDVFSKSFLGMTVACARCHDHKFDAIRAADYYALAGYLQSSRRQIGLLDPKGQIASSVSAIRQIRSEAVQLIEQGLANPSTQQAAIANGLLAAQQTLGEGPDVSEERTLELAATHDLTTSQLTNWSRLLNSEVCGQVEHPLSLWSRLMKQAESPAADVVTQWQREIADRQAQAAAQRNTVLLADFRDGIPGDWFVTGQALDRAIASEPSSILCVEPAPDAAPVVQSLAGDGVDSRQWSMQANGVLRSPTFELTHPELLYHVNGHDATIRLIIDGYVMDEFSGLLFAGAKLNVKTDGRPQWLRQSGDVGRYVGHRCHIEIIDHSGGWFRIAEIRLAERGAQPPAPPTHTVNERLAAELKKKNPFLTESDGPTKAASQLAAILAKQMIEFDAQTHKGLRWQDIAVTERLLADDLLNRLDTVAVKWAEVAKAMPQPKRVIAIADGSREDEYLFIRGNHRMPGDRIPRRFLEALGGLDQPVDSRGSGRLELARAMIADNNPLVSRVAVNRIWHHLFGVGIVPTPDNFGVLGQEPSHPDLLDFLAGEFRNDQWSVKRLIRRIVLSRTYRMAATGEQQAEQADPINRLLHRNRIRRLQSEVIRDAILQVSGRLDPKVFGASVPVHLTPFMQGRGRPGTDGPVDGHGRRSIYIAVNRNFLSPMMLAFDTPAPATAIGRRNVSNVPAQALMLLNDEFVTQQADRWAGDLLQDAEASPEDRVRRMIRAAFAREASDDEVRLLVGFLQSQANLHDLGNDTWTRDRKVWADLAHALFNAKEFVFLR